MDDFQDLPDPIRPQAVSFIAQISTLIRTAYTKGLRIGEAREYTTEDENLREAAHRLALHGLRGSIPASAGFEQVREWQAEQTRRKQALDDALSAWCRRYDSDIKEASTAKDAKAIPF